MGELVNAASEFLAAIFARIGIVGRPRRRAAIRDEIQLLHEIRDSPDFGTESRAHRYLADHVTTEVARYSGIELKRKRNIPWGSVFLALAIGLPLGYWTYRLNDAHFSWFSVLPGSISALMLIAALGFLTGDSNAEEDQASSADAHRPLSDEETAVLRP